MDHRKKRTLCWVALLAVGCWLAGCTPRPYLPIRYVPPAERDASDGIRVAVVFQDQRAESSLLTPAAAVHMKDFTGHLALVLAPEGSAETHLGSQSLADLFHSSLRWRLSAEGISAAPAPTAADAVLVFRLEQFRLDRVRDRWRVRIAYTAKVSAPGNPERSASQSVSAEGERRKLLGGKQVEKLVGEVFTDALNRLEPADLLRRAGLR